MEDTEPSVYLNGQFVPMSKAAVSVMDRGFLFGDGVYEVVPVYGRLPFRWAQHHARLTRSLGKLRIQNPMDAQGWRTLINSLVERHPWSDQFVYLQVTRGAPTKRDHTFPKGDVPPTVFAMTSPLPTMPAASISEGVAAITLPDERWLHCDIKSISLLGNVLAKQAAAEAGAAECLMFRGDRLTEGAAANIWVVVGGRVLAPPRDNLILEGIRYGLLQELCEAEGIGFEVRPVLRPEVESADEILVSSAIREIQPVTRLDGRPVGSGRPGPVFKRLYDAYQRAKSRGAPAGQALV